jgi:transcription elongation factor GreA-like protein/transcription elongation GreA/GreB family factor
MDYRKKLRQLKDDEDWDKLLSESLSLYENGTDDRYVIRMIVKAYEALGKEEEVLPFWELLAREEYHSEEFSRKLIAYHKARANEDRWIEWSEKLLIHSLRSKDYATVEDIWMQLVEAKRLKRTFALDITERLIAQEQEERAYTLLDIYVLSIEDDPPEALPVAKRMLKLEPLNLDLRKRIEGFYRKLYEGCTAVEQFLEKANIRKSDDVQKALESLERLIRLCPGNYVSHKSWGIGKVRSVDLLFGKVCIDFPTNPNHSIEVERALTMLEPLSKDDFAVQKIIDPSALKKLQQDNPIELIKLLVKDTEILPQKRVRTMLEGIVADGEWQSFFDRVKKEAKAAGLKLTRKGSSYLFSLSSGEEQSALSLESITSMKNRGKKLKALLLLAQEELSPEDARQWNLLANECLQDDRTTPREKAELLFARKEVARDTRQFQDSLAGLIDGMELQEKLSLIEDLSKKKLRKEFLTCIGHEDREFTKAVFHQTADDTLRGHALRMLEEETTLPQLLPHVLQNPLNMPLCFLYCIERTMKETERPRELEKPIIVLEILIELMVHAEVQQKVRSRAKTIFEKFGFDLYRWMLETSSKEEITVLLDMIKKHPHIESAEKLTFEKLAESRFPTLKEKPKELFFYATKEAIQKKQKELDYLLKVEIPANSAEIGRAARQGDLSENFDYIAAKEKQRKLIDRVQMLKSELSQVQPIEGVAFTEGEAAVGTRITVKSKETGTVREITILGPWDAIPEQNIISHTAPLAQEIIGKKVGESFFDSFYSENLEIVKISKFIPGR